MIAREGKFLSRLGEDVLPQCSGEVVIGDLRAHPADSGHKPDHSPALPPE